MSLTYYSKEENNIKEESINNYKDLFLEYENNLPTLSEALEQLFIFAGLDKKYSEELIQDILFKCNKAIDNNFEQITKRYNNITKEDAYIICSYTCESINKAYSPYKILNKNLNSENRKNGLNNVSKYLYILLKSLRVLPKYNPSKINKYIYRCIPHDVPILFDPENKKSVPYIEGNRKTFWGFISTSPNIKKCYNFLKEEQIIKSSTILILRGNFWGYDISLFNYFKEEEILLEPETNFIVDNVLPPINKNIDTTYITLKVLKNPLILKENNVVSSSKFNNYLEEDSDSIVSKSLVRIEMEIKLKEGYKYKSGIGLICKIPSKNMKAFITYNHIP